MKYRESFLKYAGIYSYLITRTFRRNCKNKIVRNGRKLFIYEGILHG